MYGTPPDIPGLVQTNITNSAEEKWAKTLRWKIAKLRMRREKEEQFYTTLN